MNVSRPTLTPLLAALAATFALAACNRNDDGMTAGQKVDAAVAKVERKTDETKAQIQESTQDARQAASQATDKVTSAVNDAAITTSINAELAKDSKLSATKIDVDTAQGRVALRGSAPDAESKDRATRIAASVKGVTSVDNLLTIDAKS
jgi:osmotically-inducible protein OsmY